MLQPVHKGADPFCCRGALSLSVRTPLAPLRFAHVSCDHQIQISVAYLSAARVCGLFSVNFVLLFLFTMFGTLILTKEECMVPSVCYYVLHVFVFSYLVLLAKPITNIIVMF